MPRVGKSMGRKRNARRNQLSGAHSAESWNSTYPVGTHVRYWPIYPPIESAPPVDTTTRTIAWTLGDGSVVVSIVGKTGGVHLSHVEVLNEGDAPAPGELALSLEFLGGVDIENGLTEVTYMAHELPHLRRVFDAASAWHRFKGPADG